MPDSEVLAFAVRERRILLSNYRRHFLNLHQRRTADHAGIVLCTFDPDFRGQALRINAAIEDMPDMKNQLLRINRPG